MGIVFRQSIKSTIVIAVGALMGVLINLAYPFILSETELGYTTLLPVMAAISHMFVMFGIGSTIINFSPRYGHRDDRRKILITLSTLAPLIITTLLSIPYFIFKTEVLHFFKPEDRLMAGTFYAIVPLFIFIWSYMVTLECYLISQSKTALISLVREVIVRGLNIVLLGLVFLKIITFPQFIYGIVTSYFIAVLALLFVARKTDDFGVSANWRVFNKAEYKEIFQYSWYHMLVTATLSMLGFVDVLLLSSLSPEGLSSVAVYGRAVFIVTVMVIPYRAMAPASIPTLNNAYLSGDHKQLSSLFHRSSLNIFIAATAMFLLIACNLDNVVAILPESYSELKPIALILMVGRIIDMATGLNTEVTSISKYYKFNFRISVLLLVMLVGFCYLLIPEYGTYGAAWGTTIALGIFNIAKMSFLWWKMKLQPFTSKTLLVVVAGALSFAVGYWFPYILNPVVDAMIRSVIIVIAYAGLLIWMKPSEDLNSYLHSIKTNKRLF